MKVLRHVLVSPTKGWVNALSKDQAQFDATLAEIHKQEAEVTVDGTGHEITIPDNSVYASMIEHRTVILNDDEMDVVYDAPENV